MGMFDSVMVRCPSCNHLNEIQSKVGDCELEYYQPDLVPTIIALAIEGTHWCDSCDEPFALIAEARRYTSVSVHKEVISC